jgi:hypothetical protein
MRFGKPPPGKPESAPPRPPVRSGGQKSSKAKTVRDDGETRGTRGKVAAASSRMLGSTGKGPPPGAKAAARPKVPKGPGAGMLPGIAGPGLAPPQILTRPILQIGQRPTLGKRTQAAMRRRGR